MSIIEEVTRWVEQHAEEDQKAALEDLQKHGCVSGQVGALIYYPDTVKFYEENRDEINQLLAGVQSDTGQPVLPEFRGYDKDDPLCLEQNNQNMLAWWGFEEVAFELYREKYEE